MKCAPRFGSSVCLALRLRHLGMDHHGLHFFGSVKTHYCHEFCTSSGEREKPRDVKNIIVNAHTSIQSRVKPSSTRRTTCQALCSLAAFQRILRPQQLRLAST